MGKIYCTECGAELDDSVKFCSKCGTKVNNKNNNSNKITDNNKSSTIEIKELGKKISYKKYLGGALLAIIMIIILSFVIVNVTFPLYSTDYDVDASDYSLQSTDSFPTFDNEFKGSNVNFKDNLGNGKIDIWQHSAHGYDVDYYLKQYSTYDKDDSNNPAFRYYNVDYGLKIKHTNNITVDNVKGYIMDGTWGIGYEYTWVILVHDDEYYLICFDDINQERRDKFLDSFRFKDN